MLDRALLFLLPPLSTLPLSFRVWSGSKQRSRDSYS